MPPESELVKGFSDDESERVEKHLSKLILHLTPNQFVIVGGLAIRYHLHKAGIRYPSRPFNDLDIIAEKVDVVHPDIAKDFLVYHFHQKDDFFYFAFVDEETRTKVDIFDWEKPPDKVVEIPFKNGFVKIKSIEDQLATTVYDIQRISDEAKVDPKQFLDAKLLSQVADMRRADELWRKRRKPEYPESISDAIQRAEAIKQEHPEWVKKSPFRKPGPYICSECVNSSDFPLTPMDRVYKLLGYIE